jgi:hypothetical protein
VERLRDDVAAARRGEVTSNDFGAERSKADLPAATRAYISVLRNVRAEIGEEAVQARLLEAAILVAEACPRCATSFEREADRL